MTEKHSDLLQFVEPISDWSLHLLLHLGSEQLQPLRSHHLIHKAHYLNKFIFKHTYTQIIFHVCFLLTNNPNRTLVGGALPAVEVLPPLCFCPAARLAARPAGAALCPADSACRCAGVSPHPEPGSAHPAGCNQRKRNWMFALHFSK